MIDTIQRVYGALLPPAELPEHMYQLQHELVKCIIYYEHFRMYPPARSYQRKFWKYVVEEIEQGNEEVCKSF